MCPSSVVSFCPWYVWSSGLLSEGFPSRGQVGSWRVDVRLSDRSRQKKNTSDRKINNFCKFFDDHLYTGMCENIDFSLKIVDLRPGVVGGSGVVVGVRLSFAGPLATPPGCAPQLAPLPSAGRALSA